MAKLRTEPEWRALLTPEQYRILREKDTEPANSGEYNKFSGTGIYRCAGCEAPLYKSDTKFNSGCGWPAFFDAIPGILGFVNAVSGAVERHRDESYGRIRTEITCTSCGGHLGHVFEGEGFKTPTDARHCVNSISIKFKES